MSFDYNRNARPTWRNRIGEALIALSVAGFWIWLPLAPRLLSL